MDHIPQDISLTEIGEGESIGVGLLVLLLDGQSHLVELLLVGPLRVLRNTGSIAPAIEPQGLLRLLHPLPPDELLRWLRIPGGQEHIQQGKTHHRTGNHMVGDVRGDHKAHHYASVHG